MKVLLPWSHIDRPGGIGNYKKLLTKHIDKKKCELKIFTYGVKPSNRKIVFLLPMYFFSFFLKYPIKLISDKIDLIHLNPSLNWASIIRGFVLLRIAKSMNYPVLFFFRGWRWSLFENIKKNNKLRKIFVKNLKTADKILVLSQDFKDALIELGIDEDKIKMSSTMVEIEKYKTENKNFDGLYNVLFCGNIAKAKGVYELLQAINVVIEKNKNLNFIFIGDGPELENLKKKTEKMGIEEHVTFTGYKKGEEKYEIYKKSHLFVLPSYTEGFPNVALEAMAAGLPIIATPVGALKYAIEDGKNGWKLESVPPEPEEIAEKIIELIEDPDLMKEMSENNLLEAKSKYDVKAVTDDIVKIYKEICFDNN